MDEDKKVGQDTSTVSPVASQPPVAVSPTPVPPLASQPTTAPPTISPPPAAPISEVSAGGIKRSLSKKLFLIIGVLVLLAVLSSGAYAYVYVYNSPDNRVKRTFDKFTQVNSFAFTSEARVEILEIPGIAQGLGVLDELLPKQKKNSYMEFTFDGAMDSKDINAVKAKYTLGVKTDMVKPDLSMQIEIRMLQNIIYLQPRNLPVYPNFDISFFNNKWIKIDSDELLKKYKIKQQDPEKTRLTKEQEAQMRQAFEKYTIFKVTDVLPDEEIGTVAVNHYKFTIDKEQVRLFVDEALSILRKDQLSEQGRKDIRKIVADMKEENLKSISSEIWIGKNDVLPYKLLILTVPKDPTRDGKGTLTVNFKDYNKPVSVDAPTFSQTFEEVGQEFVQYMQEEAVKRASESASYQSILQPTILRTPSTVSPFRPTPTLMR